MKNNKIEKLIDALYSVRMTEEEKKAMQDHVLGFARTQAVPSPYRTVTKILYQSLSVAFMALLTIGSLSKPAAAGALPGEFLYPIKMIHEELESVTKHSSEDKISHEIERTNTRIEEATELAENKTLDIKKRQQIAKNIKKHTNKVKSEIQELKTDDPIKALELNHQLQNSIKSNVDRLKTRETGGIASAEIQAVVVNSEIQKQPPVAEEARDSDTASEEKRGVNTTDTHKDEPLPAINEIDIALSVPATEDSEDSEFNDLLKEMEADLREAEAEYQKTEKNVTKSVITPSGINIEDEMVISETNKVTTI